MNPIGFKQIDAFANEVIQSEKHEFLIIDTGNHDFESIQVIKYFREKFMELEEFLSRFNKIALVRLSIYKNESTNPGVYNYFDSVDKAKKWFRKV